MKLLTLITLSILTTFCFSKEFIEATSQYGKSICDNGKNCVQAAATGGPCQKHFDCSYGCKPDKKDPSNIAYNCFSKNEISACSKNDGRFKSQKMRCTCLKKFKRCGVTNKSYYQTNVKVTPTDESGNYYLTWKKLREKISEVQSIDKKIQIAKKIETLMIGMKKKYPDDQVYQEHLKMIRSTFSNLNQKKAYEEYKGDKKCFKTGNITGGMCSHDSDCKVVCNLKKNTTGCVSVKDIKQDSKNFKAGACSFNIGGLVCQCLGVKKCGYSVPKESSCK